MTERRGYERAGYVPRDDYELLKKMNCALIADELEIGTPVDVYTIDPAQGEFGDATVTSGEILSARRMLHVPYWNVVVNELDLQYPNAYHPRPRVMSTLGVLVEARSGETALEEVGIITGKKALERARRMAGQAPPDEPEQQAGPEN